MIFATAFVLQRLLTFDGTTRENVVNTAILWSGVAVFSVIHCRIIDLTVHSAVFGSMIFFIAHRVRVSTIEVKDRRRQRELNSLAWRGSSTVILNDFLAIFMLTSTFTVYLGAGLALWALDSLACSRLRQIRRQIGVPWGFMLELHGW